MVDSLKICHSGVDEYPGYLQINKIAACCVDIYNMLLFNTFLFDIYKWGVFIISSN